MVAADSERSAQIATLQNAPNDVDHLKASYATREGYLRNKLDSILKEHEAQFQQLVHSRAQQRQTYEELMSKIALCDEQLNTINATAKSNFEMHCKLASLQQLLDDAMLDKDWHAGRADTLTAIASQADQTMVSRDHM